MACFAGGWEVHRREGISQSIHPIRLAGGHSPTDLGPMPQPQVQDWFPKQKEAKPGSHGTLGSRGSNHNGDGGMLFLTVEGFLILQAHS